MVSDPVTDNDNAKQEILAALDRLKQDSILDDLRHRSLSDLVKSAGEELGNLDRFFHEKIESVALPITDSRLLISGRSALARSASIVCSHLRDFESAMLKHTGDDHGVLKKGFDWILEGLMAELGKFAKALQFDGWSISATAGLPAGVSFSITFSFK